MSRSPIVQRTIQKEVIQTLRRFPFISITGPRQSGKTTLCHIAGNNFEYINFEQADREEFALRDPKAFIDKYPYQIILDEVQKVPKLFNALMVHTDKLGKNGAYILSGSQNFLLMEKISQTLAGRVAVFSLLPLSLQEIFPYLNASEKKWESLAIRGFYPMLYKDKKVKTNIFYKSYIETYVQRDVRQLVNIQEARLFKLFMKMCAIRAGNIVNFAEIGAQLGVDQSTIKRWISILETSYIIFLLPGYYKNFDKRVIKKPKLYFCDTGILNYLLNITEVSQLKDHKMREAIFENFVIVDLLKKRFNNGLSADIYFWQDTNGNEVDLIIEDNSTLHIYELKSGTTPMLEFAKNINKFAELVKTDGGKVKKYLLYGGTDSYKIKDLQISSWLQLAE